MGQFSIVLAFLLATPFAFASDCCTVYSVLAAPNPPQAGTIYGTGTGFSWGSYATLRQVPNPGYAFKGWQAGQLSNCPYSVLSRDSVLQTRITPHIGTSCQFIAVYGALGSPDDGGFGQSLRGPFGKSSKII